MQYKDFILQITADGCIIRNKNGKYIATTANENDAKDYIDTTDIDDNSSRVDYVKLFYSYCKNLPGRCYPDGKLASVNEKALIRYIRAFEKSHSNIKIQYKPIYIGGEIFYTVTNIIEN